ncbi:unnamed protein product [Penicillium salamii]|uniref:Uncharacterized protein n=1 Tax=Penicillium salamii TaxID=1612424 RepID=A0A9W4JC04_9EURO|nr:unnamed protein product [Penicillium salamii]CAG8140219.1 unnamed protein product [Penicillium salamii]CAG8143526.1 unnamed protein product [Penicillium salamii]CAG8159973.1 unnamed protein product [Penicillium salamii]CAG8161513.1 unnamed protein product [Penicillium salamii]
MPSNAETRYTSVSTEKNAPKQPVAEISRSKWVLWLVGFYTTLVLFSWIMVCLLNYRPVTIASYQKYPNNAAPNPYRTTWQGSISSQPMRAKYVHNERWYKAVQVLQSIVGVLTIPVTSAVCSSAVVVYLQCRTDKLKPKITLPWALALHLVGAIISPVQQIFLSTELVKTPTNITRVGNLHDMPDKFIQDADFPKLIIVPMTRKLLESTSANDIPSQLWTKDIDCAETNSDRCSQSGSKWTDLSTFPDVFWAQLPNNYSTGLIRQYLPRFNSSTQYEFISEKEFPRGCEDTARGLSLKHNHTLVDPAGGRKEDMDYWALHACMPDDQIVSPWKNTRDRQDFGEVLYLNITLSPRIKDGLSVESVYVRVIVNTTAGYFELPNYMNGQTAGSLLEKFPYDTCDSYCDEQGFTGPNKIAKKKRERHDIIPWEADRIEEVFNKGPLLTTALALFGRYSWIETANRFDTLYGFRKQTHDLKIVADLAPMGRIIRVLQGRHGNDEPSEDSNHYTGINDGVLSQSHHAWKENAYHEAEMFDNIVLWLVNFRPRKVHISPLSTTSSDKIMADAFNIAAYLANMAWVIDTSQLRIGPTLSVTYDAGADSKKPSISLAGIILVSILIMFHLVGLAMTALYASWFPRWTNALNAFSLLRLGGSIHAHVPLRVSANDDQVNILDALPGWVGHAPKDFQSRDGDIQLGAPGPLRMRTAYDAYEGCTVKPWRPQSKMKKWSSSRIPL